MNARVSALLNRLDQSRLTITARRNLIDELRRELVGVSLATPMHAHDAELLELGRQIRAAVAVWLATSTASSGPAADERVAITEQLGQLEQRLCECAKRPRA